MKDAVDKIVTFNPFVFRKELIANGPRKVIDNPFIDDFFIHSFNEDIVDLKLPLPPHRKTVHDFVFVRKGQLNRALGIDKFELKANQALFTPKNSITSTEYASEDLEGYFLHFSDQFIGANMHLNSWVTQSLDSNYLILNEQQVRVAGFLKRM